MKPRVATAQVKRRFNPSVRGEKMLRETFLALCERSKTPFSFKAFHLFQQGDFDSISMLSVDPFFYEWNSRDAEFELDYQIASFFKKYQDFTLGIDTEKAAYDKWLKAEESCCKINQFFRDRWNGGFKNPQFRVEEVYYLARRKITEILGTVGPADLAFIRAHARHGPGADLDLRRRDASLYGKFQQQGSITPACVSLYDELYTGEESYFEADFAHESKLVCSSRLSFVTKTARIDRGVSIPPRWNGFIQLAIGELISKRLRRYGQDINNQTRNQEAARRAYRDGLATLDLSSASDSISSNLVIDLLSTSDPFWIELLLKSRTPYTEYKGKSIRLEKIDSMGNGYVFPLETLIFYAFAYATCQFEKADTRQVSVYGDDIIVPRQSYSLLAEVLETFGFSVNADKSYASGAFYESCGKDYYRGREVRPFFVKKKIDTLFDAMVLHNQIVDWSGRNQVLPGLLNKSRWDIANRYIFRSVPQKYRFCGPVGVSGVFHTEFPYWVINRHLTANRRHCGFEGCVIRTLQPVPLKTKVFGWRGLLYSKLSADMDSGHYVERRSDEPVYGLRNMLVPYFPDFVIDEVRGMSSAVW